MSSVKKDSSDLPDFNFFSCLSHGLEASGQCRITSNTSSVPFLCLLLASPLCVHHTFCSCATLTVGTWLSSRRWLSHIVGPLYDWVPWSFNSDLFTLSLQKCVTHSRRVSAGESLLRDVVMAWVCLSVSPVLRIQEELLHFQFLLLFTCSGRAVTPNLLTWGTLRCRTDMLKPDILAVILILVAKQLVFHH